MPLWPSSEPSFMLGLNTAGFNRRNKPRHCDQDLDLFCDNNRLSVHYSAYYTSTYHIRVKLDIKWKFETVY